MASKKERIITVIFPGASNFAKLSVDNIFPASKSLKTLNCLKKPEKCSEFLKQITSFIHPTTIKGIVFLFFENLEHDSIKNQQIIKEKFREFCKKYEIFCHFPSMQMVILNGLLTNVKPKLNDGDFIAVVLVHEMISFQALQYSADEKNFEFKTAVKFSIANLTITKELLMKEYNFKHLILFTFSCEHGKQCDFENHSDKVAKLFSSENVKISVFNQSFETMCFEASIKMIQSLMNTTECKKMEFMVKYFCSAELSIGSLIKCQNGQFLPFEKTVVHNILNGSCITLRETGKGKIESIDLNEYNSKKVEITFKLDIDMIYDIEIKAVGPPLRSVPKKSSNFSADKLADVEKVKISFTQNHFSIFIVKNGKKKVVKDSNGSANIPLCISFVEDIPVIGEKAEAILRFQPTFVVYDLMKLCSKDILQNKDPKWPFKVRKNSKNNISIEFDTVSGRRKKAADIFIKIILIFSLELIEKESGKKFEEIGIEFEGFGNKEDLFECFLKAAEKINVKLVFL